MLTLTNRVDPDYESASYMIRGIIINGITVLERVIDTFLASHFCEKQQRAAQLMKLVFASKHITFENKRMIFNNILNVNYTEYAKKHLPNIHADLDKFNKHRNNVAHFVLDVSPENIEHFTKTSQISLLKFDKQVAYVRYSISEAEQIQDDIFKFIKPVADLTSVIDR